MKECVLHQKMCGEAWAQGFCVNPFWGYCIFLSLYSHFPLHLDLLFLLYLLSCSRHKISALNLFLSLNLFLFTVGTTHEVVNAVPSPKFNANITTWLLRGESHFWCWWGLQTWAHSSASGHSQRGPWVRNVILVFQKKRHLSSHAQQAQHFFFFYSQARQKHCMTNPSPGTW